MHERDCRVLVLGHEFMLADELQTELDDAVAIVIDPSATANGSGVA